jgi:Domain of unknown function (DUF1830)
MGKQPQKIDEDDQNQDDQLQCQTLILCSYTNSTSRAQIVRIENVQGWFLERVVISGGSIIFEAPLTAQLEVFSSEAVTTALYDRIWCRQLQFCADSEASLDRRNDRRRQRSATLEMSAVSSLHTA